jgi:hypothetical protein
MTDWQALPPDFRMWVVETALKYPSDGVSETDRVVQIVELLYPATTVLAEDLPDMPKATWRTERGLQGE